MSKRLGLIIEASEVPGELLLPGAKVDAENLRTWLYSKPGGDWYSSEILILHTPTVQEVRNVIAKAGKCDYAFIGFSGHGYHSKELDQTKLVLRDGTLAVADIRPDADRATVVVDACRNIMSEAFAEQYSLSASEKANYRKAAETRNFRQEFDLMVQIAESGFEYLYSCNLRESAGESTRTGGYFTRYLLEAGRDYSDNHSQRNSCLHVAKAFEIASAATTRKNSTQHPQLEAGRRRLHFPFAL